MKNKSKKVFAKRPKTCWMDQNFIKGKWKVCSIL